ncbi:MAG: CAP domain-containing protein [Rubellimicrobium sp.]|nr:CAP domain-containing protein [Rubellimicrobium sp.]
MTTFLLAAAGAALLGCDEVPVTSAAAPEATPEAAAAPAPTVAVATDAAFEAGLDALRARHGLSAATPDARLARAAQLHAEDMVRQGYFDHVSRDGRTYIQRIAAQGYPTCWPVENIAFGSHDASGALAQWTGSPPHLRNMLTSGSVAYGLGHAGNIYVLDLARTC